MWQKGRFSSTNFSPLVQEMHLPFVSVEYWPELQGRHWRSLVGDGSMYTNSPGWQLTLYCVHPLPPLENVPRREGTGE